MIESISINYNVTPLNSETRYENTTIDVDRHCGYNIALERVF